MQRHLYTVLLFVSTILAVTVCLRPHLGVELMAKAGPWLEEGTSPARPVAAPPSLSGAYGITSGPPAQPTPGGRPASWPARPDPQVRPLDPDEIIEGESEPFQAADAPLPGQVPLSPSQVRPQTGPVSAPNWWQQPPAAPGAAMPPAAIPGPDAVLQGESEPWPPRQDRSPPESSPPRESQAWAPREPGPAYGNPYPAGPAPGEAAPAERPRPAPVTVIPTEEAPPAYPKSSAQEDLPVEAIPCEGAQIVARVASHAILMSDVWVGAEQYLAATLKREKDKHKESLGQLTPEIAIAQRDMLVKAQFQPLVDRLVQTKLAYYEALNTIPAEGLKNIEEQLNKIYDKSELPKLMDLYQAGSTRELDQRLTAGGTSVHRHRRAFLEQTLSAQWIAQQIKISDEVGHEEMLTWYQEHLSEFERPTRARWEQITVRVSKHPSREAARAVLARAGNQVLDGRPLADVAREVSDGANATQGGQRDWTTQGSLVSETLDRAIFGLPVGRLSPILDDGDSLHIVRVIEREDGQRTPFVEAQVKIREEIRKQRNRLQQQAYVDRLRERVPVWTMFDDRPARRPAGQPGA